ncbi:hypothetical protein A1O1_01517 [Capronia coronata CBS 617.96]|uniref:Thiaminase-2/PQQC domain-containing protein n=1 Tax=Capronia coronata CBS 617.96 TaxID=1182541 RepID=W9Z492_9EURO|nr:uncharacterized protein A1O1_01517 [Capronia coronata CBS 617.96]EXJ96391.1 hypothetical protein A1O1_01517 [Capronia coronata CBS 617.96]
MSVPKSSSPPPSPVPTAISAQEPRLTTLLLESDAQSLDAACQHPFLRLAGSGSLPKSTLSRWLSQDRLYAQTYIGFIGALIARVDLPHGHIPEKDKDKQSSLRWRIVRLLSSALENILRELAFFDTTARKYGLSLDAPSRSDGVFAAEPATQEYIDLFRSFGADPSRSLLEGLVVLWATENVYLRAWTHAAMFTNATEENRSKDGDSAADLDSGALRSAFIPNWSSIEFEEFVDEIAEVTDLLAEREGALDHGLDVYMALWARVLDVEARFWPQV